MKCFLVLFWVVPLAVAGRLKKRPVTLADLASWSENSPGSVPESGLARTAAAPAPEVVATKAAKTASSAAASAKKAAASAKKAATSAKAAAKSAKKSAKAASKVASAMDKVLDEKEKDEEKDEAPTTTSTMAPTTTTTMEPTTTSTIAPTTTTTMEPTTTTATAEPTTTTMAPTTTTPKPTTTMLRTTPKPTVPPTPKPTVPPPPPPPPPTAAPTQKPTTTKPTTTKADINETTNDTQEQDSAGHKNETEMDPYERFLHTCRRKLKARVLKAEKYYTHPQIARVLTTECELDEKFPTVRDESFKRSQDCKKFVDMLVEARSAEMDGKKHAYDTSCKAWWDELERQRSGAGRSNMQWILVAAIGFVFLV